MRSGTKGASLKSIPDLEVVMIDPLSQMLLLVKPDEELWTNQIKIILTERRTIESKCWTVGNGFRLLIWLKHFLFLYAGLIVEWVPYFWVPPQNTRFLVIERWAVIRVVPCSSTNAYATADNFSLWILFSFVAETGRESVSEFEVSVLGGTQICTKHSLKRLWFIDFSILGRNHCSVPD